MHEVNHPDALHLTSNIWHVDPLDLVKPGQRIGLAWFSPDCKHHSKAKGGKPVENNIRDLGWIIPMWAERVRPDVIMLENVEEFQDWGPLTDDKRPDPDQKGQTFDKWVRKLRRLGYRVQWRQLRACDYGAPTIRKRLFIIARRDGQPIVWPEPTHGAPGSAGVLAGSLQPWRTAAEIIDWSLPCPSIFDTSAQIKAKFGLRAVRPLKDNTLRRIARGVQRYVIDAKEPYFVTLGQHGGSNRSADAPHHTITASAKDQNAVVVPSLVSVAHGDSGGRREYPLDDPIGTVSAGGVQHAVVAAFMAQHNTGAVGRPADAPLATITSRSTQITAVAVHMMSLHGTDRRGSDIDTPVQSICAGGGHASLVAAFMTKYYGQGDGAICTEPMHTVTTRDRFGLITVQIDGQTWAIVDIGMRMLTPRELFRAQGFPDSYVIDRGPDGRAMTKTEQIRMCGNSVCPPLAAALVRANCRHLAVKEMAA